MLVCFLNGVQSPEQLCHFHHCFSKASKKSTEDQKALNDNTITHENSAHQFIAKTQNIILLIKC